MTHRCIRILALASFLCLLVSPLIAAETAERLATMSVGSGFVTFDPQIPYSEVRVTLSGPAGLEVVEVFTADRTPSVEVPGDDGFYKYELRFSPVLDAAARAALAAAREAGTEPSGFKAGAYESSVQSGSFTIAGGSLVAERREIEPKVVLTNGDGVIRNSLCVGLDCPDAPVFSDSTILLMENNTRIKFGDTSNAPFPNNDWEIEANSSLSGGANYLGFNDCGTADNDGGCADDVVFAVEAGARSSALYVESDGDIGIGTNNPVVDVHVVTGNTPTLRLDQDGSSGFTPQVWDLAGNETNFFVRDVTGGSRLPLRIRPGAPTSSIDISASGNIGIKTSSPAADLHVVDTSDNAEIQMDTASQSWKWRVLNAGSHLVVIDNTNSKTPFRMAPNTDTNVFGLGINTAGADASTTVSFGRDTGPNVTVDIQGSVIVDGATVHADYVFEPGFDLESIEDHSAFMWQNQHLPALPKAPEGGTGRVDIVSHQMGILAELEKAHIYIEQLHGRIGELEGQLQELQELRSLVQSLVEERTGSE